MNPSGAEQRGPRSPADAAPQPDGRARRWNRHREQRRLELLRLARHAVADLGPGASMAEIAAHCRTSKSVFYRYFKDKEGLRRELATFVVERMGRRMSSAAAEAPSFQATIRALVEQYLRQIESAPSVYRFVTHGLDVHAENPLGRFATAASELLIEAHRRHAPAERWLDPAMASYWAAGVVGMVRGAGEAWMAPVAAPGPGTVGTGPASVAEGSVPDAADRAEDGPTTPAARPAIDEMVEIITAWIVAGTAPPGSDAQARASP